MLVVAVAAALLVTLPVGPLPVGAEDSALTLNPEARHRQGHADRAAVAAVRLSLGEPSEPASFAVAMSQLVFPDNGAAFVILANAGSAADALSASALSMGVAPVLFVDTATGLSAATGAEIQRVIPAGVTVVLMGGTAAIPDPVAAQVAALGRQPLRLAGTGREHTAALAAALLDEVRASFQLPPAGIAFVARGDDWADAITVGGLAAAWGLPILLTPTTFLHPVTGDRISSSAVEGIYVLGGEAALSGDVITQLRTLPQLSSVSRLAGGSRSDTAVHIAALHDAVKRQILGMGSSAVLAANVRHPAAYPYILAATPLAVYGVLAPVEAPDGTVIDDVVRQAYCGMGVGLAVLGGRDLVGDATAADLANVLAGYGCGAPAQTPTTLEECLAGNAQACVALFPETAPPAPGPAPSGDASCRRSSYIPGFDWITLRHPDGDVVEVQADSRDFKRTARLRVNGQLIGEFDIPVELVDGVTALLDQRITLGPDLNGEVQQTIKQVPVLEVCGPWQGQLP